MEVKNICIFCGSSLGISKEYEEMASVVSRELSKNNINLVYGGGSMGLMGVFAQQMHSNGSKIIGVSPKRFEKKNSDTPYIDEHIIVNSMHDRKAVMYKKADAFIVFPGGVGTLEEFSEIFTWSQIGLNSKPIALFNMNSFFNSLLEFFQHQINEKFMDEKKMDNLFISDSIEEIIKYFNSYQRSISKWEE